jgi:RNA polymerase sigma-70 factor (ECF subfamily)
MEKHLHRLWSRLYGYAVTLTGNAEQARELMQDVAVKALAARRVPSADRAVRAWLFTIVRNAWIDRLRSERRHVLGTSGESAGEGSLQSVWRFDESFVAEITVRQALGRIDPIYRDIIALVDIAGFGYAEAADIARIPVGTVMSRISRGRAALLDVIAETNLRPLASKRRRG